MQFFLTFWYLLFSYNIRIFIITNFVRKCVPPAKLRFVLLTAVSRITGHFSHVGHFLHDMSMLSHKSESGGDTLSSSITYDVYVQGTTTSINWHPERITYCELIWVTLKEIGVMPNTATLKSVLLTQNTTWHLSEITLAMPVRFEHDSLCLLLLICQYSRTEESNHFMTVQSTHSVCFGNSITPLSTFI